ncbi:hypothetical protein [Azorhizobium oxalatiphilum]|uniref:hypothetical protein n=1 Tax=Azorhizobium oxalatiphilum TaxID=980631 RepID=UPI001666728E|nr:hypothetical protein [Azorhizobium oxalatiphilum]
MGVSVRSIYLQSQEACETEFFPLPAGRYTGIERQEVVIGDDGQATWREPRYAVMLLQPDLGQIGGVDWRDRRSAEIDVTEHVTAGRMEPSRIGPINTTLPRRERSPIPTSDERFIQELWPSLRAPSK